jgi:hypothetical protein
MRPALSERLKAPALGDFQLFLAYRWTDGRTDGRIEINQVLRRLATAAEGFIFISPCWQKKSSANFITPIQRN